MKMMRWKFRILLSFIFWCHDIWALSSYLDSLSNPTVTHFQEHEQHYQDSLESNNNHHQQQQDENVSAMPMILQEVVLRTPDEHYAKKHPGAGWAGFRHPQFGGYLDNLRANEFEEGKQKDYGDDVRWGAEVYLDALK